MSKLSVKSNKDLSRPFDAMVLSEARRITDQYQIVVRHEDDYWYGHGLELGLAMGGGQTVQACIDDTREAMALSVATMLENGHIPPVPASEGKRTEQVNVKLTCEERAVLMAASQARGFKGLSDFIRVTVLSEG